MSSQPQDVRDYLIIALLTLAGLLSALVTIIALVAVGKFDVVLAAAFLPTLAMLAAAVAGYYIATD